MSKSSEELGKVVQKHFLNIPMQPHELAERINKPYSTIMREINPYDDKAKLGIQTFYDIMIVTGCINTLRFMADKLGYELVRKKPHTI